jgi:predicted O-methyltransferase YrrM
MKDYIKNLNQISLSDDILDIIKYANENDVPIMQEQGMFFLMQLIKAKRPQKILEIGTAIGYSSIQMAIHSTALIDTIEKNSEMVRQALQNIVKLGLTDRITCYFQDALEMDVTQLRGEYDVIFIDAAKAQYEKFFVKYEPLLKLDGIIVSDNLLFHGLVVGDHEVSKNTKSLITKIKKYTQWLKNHPNFDTTFYEIGDGIAVSERKRQI